jgi:hypothetical protein
MVFHGFGILSRWFEALDGMISTRLTLFVPLSLLLVIVMLSLAFWLLS